MPNSMRDESDETPLEKDQIQGGRARLAVKNSMPASDQGISILSCWLKPHMLYMHQLVHGLPLEGQVDCGRRKLNLS